MPDSTRAPGNSAPGVGAQRGAGPDRAPGANPHADAAEAAIDASRQAGVVNPAELAEEIAKAYARSPQEGAALQAAVNEQLGERDRQDLAAALPSTLGAVAGARAADRVQNTPQGFTDRQLAQTSDAVHAKAREMGLGGDMVAQGSRVTGTAKPTSDIDLAIRVSPEKFTDFLNNQSRLGSANPGTAKARTYGYSAENGIVQRGEARLSPTGKALETKLGVLVDLSVVRQGGAFDQGRSMPIPTERAAYARTAGQGALVGAATEAALGTAGALRDGRITRDEAGEIFAHTTRGAVVGGTYAVTERGLIAVADRAAGAAVARAATATAARLGAAEAAAAGTATRVAATRLAGAGAAGAVISAGVSIYENRDGLARGDSQAIGRVAGDTVVGAGAALAGAAAGAAVGSVVPVVGTAVGAVVGLGVGFAADYVMRAGGVDRAIGNAVTSGVDAVKGAASRVASWLGW